MSTDPLTLLREFTISKKPVLLLAENSDVVDNISDAKNIKFNDDAIFPREQPTNFKKTNDNKETYTLETLIFLVQNAHLDNSAYFKECRNRHIEHVSIVDRRKILDYLTGKVDQSPNVLQASTSEKRARDDATMTESSTKKPKVAPLVSDDSLLTVKQVEAREREIQTRSSVLKGTKNFTHAINLAKQLVLGKDVPASASASAAATANGRPSSQKPGASQSKPVTASSTSKSAIASKSKLSSKDRIPLIIVPAAPTAKFTLYNIKQFLEDQKYIDSQELRSDGLKKPERVTVERKKANGPAVPYHVVDSVATFKQSDWDRVCCVFVAGQLWQFKGWKWEKPVELFSNVKGFYPKWSTDKTTPPASEWAVSEINIHRNKRHMDKATVSQFWDSLDSYNATHKPYLNF